MKTNVKTNVATNVGLMFGARWPAGGPVGPGRGEGQLGRPRPSPARPKVVRLDLAWAPLNTQLCPVIVEHCVYLFPTFPVSFFWDQNDLRQRQPTRMGNCAAEFQMKQKCYAKNKNWPVGLIAWGA